MQKLYEILPELKDGWENRENGSFYKTAGCGEFDMYFSPCADNATSGNYEIGFYSKTPFKEPVKLEKKFKWYMKEFMIELPVTCIERADGWYMFVTENNGFKFFFTILRAAGE